MMTGVAEKADLAQRWEAQRTKEQRETTFVYCRCCQTVPSGFYRKRCKLEPDYGKKKQPILSALFISHQTRSHALLRWSEGKRLSVEGKDLWLIDEVCWFKLKNSATRAVILQSLETWNINHLRTSINSQKAWKCLIFFPCSAHPQMIQFHNIRIKCGWLQS